MPQIVLLAGVVVGLHGAAVLAGGSVAASRPLRVHSRVYGLVASGVGGVLTVVGVGWLLLG